MAEAELLELFEKTSKAARKACSIEDGEGTAVVDASEEARCTEALRAIGAVDISTALLLSTQVPKLISVHSHGFNCMPWFMLQLMFCRFLFLLSFVSTWYVRLASFEIHWRNFWSSFA